MLCKVKNVFRLSAFWLQRQAALPATKKVSRLQILELDAVMESGLGLGLFLEELLQDSDDAASFRQVTVLSPSVLQQHIPISAAL